MSKTIRRRGFFGLAAAPIVLTVAPAQCAEGRIEAALKRHMPGIVGYVPTPGGGRIPVWGHTAKEVLSWADLP